MIETLLRLFVNFNKNITYYTLLITNYTTKIPKMQYK